MQCISQLQVLDQEVMIHLYYVQVAYVKQAF